jgi:hypothetical protein
MGQKVKLFVQLSPKVETMRLQLTVLTPRQDAMRHISRVVSVASLPEVIRLQRAVEATGAGVCTGLSKRRFNRALR